jgi:hypothetical protein
MFSVYSRLATCLPLPTGATFFVLVGHDGRGDKPSERGPHGGMP